MMSVLARLRGNYAFILVFTTAILLFSNTFTADFVYDDSQAILTNPVVTGRVGAARAWTLDFWGNPLMKASHKSYRPLTTLSFRLNAALFGLRPFSFHLTNVILHAIASCLVLQIVEELNFFNKNREAAIFASLLFAVHPIHCEAVAGVVGRADILSAIAVITGILVYKHNENLLIAAASAATAIFFKETGIMLLPMLACITLLNYKKKPTRLRKVIFGLLSSFIILATTRHAINGFEKPSFSKSDNPVAHLPSFLVRTLTFLYLPIFHLNLMIDPRELSFDWSMDSIPLVTSATEPRALFTTAFYFTLLAIAYKLARICGLLNIIRDLLFPTGAKARILRTNAIMKGNEESARSVLLALSFLILPHLPSSNLLCYVGFVAAERILYLPSVGYCILLGMLYKSCCSRLGKTLTISFAVLVLTMLGTRTYQRNLDWKNEESLYKSALTVNPPKAYSNLGRVYAAQLRFDEAETAYKNALRHRPNMADTWYNLGVLYQEKKNYTVAVKCYESAIQFRGTFASAYLNLGIVQHELGNDSSAITIWKRCSQLDGSIIKARRDHDHAQTSCRLRLGKLYVLHKRFKEAQIILEKAIEEAPLSYQFLPSLWFTLGEVFDAQGQYSKAEKAFHAALDVAPEHIPSLLTLGYLKNKQNRTFESQTYFSRALAISPNSAKVYHHIGTAAALRGDFEDAESAYTNALKLDCNHIETLRALAILLREQGKLSKCEEVLQKLQSHHPSPDSFGDYAAILHINGKLGRAKKFYERSLQLNPRNSLVKENLSKLRKTLNANNTQYRRA
ncbi:unnamed protein product [Cylicocyclus nassatus]|uniref:dolichyl-phosphate-mannose--protein mannosyltransferase n=1 Tax=Cylicocyclus nassatus TaxID=53992 RepID=A0AA36GVM6_CYLNA|nr:unnamed protein product [Cylicocyclus nassatus]